MEQVIAEFIYKRIAYKVTDAEKVLISRTYLGETSWSPADNISINIVANRVYVYDENTDLLCGDFIIK